MPFLVEDAWIDGQATTHDIAELEDCSIAVDATYYLGHLLDNQPAHEPLLSALSGLTGIESHINEDLDQWQKHGILPFFIFDGQSITGQNDISLQRGLAANKKTDGAWDLYSQGEADQAVATFGANPGAFRLRSLYPLLQRVLRSRKLHFLVAPYNACAQLAYFEMIDSDQCAGVMGPQELLMYPIRESVIRFMDWESKTVTALSKKTIMRTLGASESMFIDALMMTGTSFLAPFPPLQDRSMYQTSFTIMDAVNILRTADKSVANACASFNDILQAQDPNWLDKYRKARMAAHHFIYIAESGEVRVNDSEHLTKDNHEYLGLQMPAELFHYLSTGLISARILNYITHSQILIQPTLDGVASDDYKKLVTSHIAPIMEQALSLIIPRIHRGIGHKDITLKAWFDPKFSYTLNHRSLQPSSSSQVSSWDVKDEVIKEFFPPEFCIPIYLEVLSLAQPEFVARTVAKNKNIKGIDSTNEVVSVATWRFLHLRGYLNDEHKLTTWGNALATTLMMLRDKVPDAKDVHSLDQAALLAFELIRSGFLNGRYQDGQPGLPRKAVGDDKSSLVLISECASLLKLRHQVFGYTGPLNKSLLSFRALSSTVREADRDLIEAILASMFMHGQCKREREDQVDISQRLPFSQEPDIALGIAVRTFFDEDDASDSKEARAAKLQEFPRTFVPLAEALVDDFRMVYGFVDALNQGVQVLIQEAMTDTEKAIWSNAQAYMDARPF
jgi:hypothetical protein